MAFITGSIIEYRHFIRLEKDELMLSDIMVTDLKRIPDNWDVGEGVLICASTVIALDYFKVWIAGWKSMIGGRIQTYETLLERARRESIVRLLKEARKLDAQAVWNLRIETSTIAGKYNGGGIEVLAYGTALKIR